MCGYLSLRACQLSLAGVVTGGGAAPVKRWFSLHSDFVLYTFKSESDCQALTATPMPGYTVLTGPELKGESGIAEKDRDKTIKMFYAPLMTSQPCSSSVSAACRKAYFFTGTCLAEVKRLGLRWPPLCASLASLASLASFPTLASFVPFRLSVVAFVHSLRRLSHSFFHTLSCL